MSNNNTSLYSTTTSGNTTVPANNNTGLYNNTGVPETVNNDIAITGNISAAGNITGGNILTEGIVSAGGNIYADNFIGNIIGNIQVPGGNTQVLFNNNGAANASANLTFNSATNILAVGGAVTATGNVTGNYILGNGALLTGLPATYGDANVTSLLNSFGSNTISTTGNVTAGYFLGDGSQLTNLPIPGIYGNTQVAAFMAAFGSNVVSTTGNVTAGYFSGDGSQLTNLPVQPGTYGNANVAAYLPTYTGNLTANTISATGNVTGSFILGNGSQLTGITTNYSNANVTSLMAAFGSNSISTSGNVTAGNFAGNGSQLTALTGANVTGTVANATFATSAGTATSATTAATVTTAAQPNITSVGTLTTVTSTGNITGGNILTGGLITATGNVTGAFILGDGSQLTNLPVQPGTYSNANVSALLPVYTGNITANTISATGNVTAAFLKTSGAQGNIVGVNYVSANFYLGDGGLLSNISSSYGNAQVATFLNAFGSNTIVTTGNITGGNINGLVAAGNIVGTVANATFATSAGTANTANTATTAGTVTANAQANITSVGTLSTLNVSNNTSGVFAATITQANATGGGLDVRSGDGSGTNTMFIVRDNGGGNIRFSVQENGTTSITNPTISLSGNVLANSLISAAGNVTGGNIITAGAVTATGNITGNYLIGDGSLITNLPGGGYGNANVNTLLASWGSNTLSTTGTVNAGNITGGNILTGGLISATGNITAANLGNVSELNLNGNSSQVLYGNGVFAAVSGGSGSPGGSDSQIQYNNGGAFGGNVAMTFDDSTGNVTLGNIVVNTNQIETVAVANLAATTASGLTTPWRILVGDGYLGNVDSAFSGITPGTLGGTMNAPRLLAADFVTLPNTGMRFNETAAVVWANLSANISNTSTRFGVTRSELNIGGGTSGFSVTATNTPTLATASSSQVYVGAGTNANLSALGNIIMSAGATAQFNGVTVNNYSAANTIVGTFNLVAVNNANATAFGNATNMIGAVSVLQGQPANANITATTTAVAFYMPGATQTLPGFIAATGNIARQATNYFSFRSDDDLAQSRLGMLSRFHELNANTANTTGTVNISKNDGQVQTIYPTGNVTIGTFTNFVTRVQKPNATFVNAADTVTLVIQQGATPYTVTMPTGNTQIRYASGLSTVNATANTTVMISITGVYDYNTAANEYLVTISPEFS
jgi:hypothetical protein